MIINRTVFNLGKPTTIRVEPGQHWLAFSDDGEDAMHVMTTGHFSPDGTRCLVIPLSMDELDGIRGTLRLWAPAVPYTLLAWPLSRTNIPVRLLRMFLGEIPYDAQLAICNSWSNPSRGITFLTGMDPNADPNEVKKRYRHRNRTLGKWHGLAA